LQEAIAKAKEEASATAAGDAGKKDNQALNEEHEQALKQATERGRMESVTKLKLKDSMLLKAQNNVKNLEAQIKAWRDAGIIPAGAPLLPSSSTASPAPAKPAAAVPVAPVATGATPAALPRKPSVAVASTGQTSAPVAAELAGRGRGAGRGVRGAGRGALVMRGTGRGLAPAAVASAVQASGAGAAPAVAGVSIIGAAGKRAREETEAMDSLSKRIKPAEVASKPIALRRDRIPPPNPTPPS